MREALLAFLCGAAVLVLEILGARLISPFYGATVYVWSSVITVTLAALAVGYAGGGWLADKRRPLPALGGLLAAAAAWLFLVPWMRRSVLLGSAVFGVQAGALCAAAVLLALPLACLGAAGPLLIRLRVTELSRVGRAAGWVSAVSTAGSVAGALAAGFWLIPGFGVGALLGGLGAGLMALAAYCWWSGRRAPRPAAFLLLAGLGLGGWTALRPGPADAAVRFHARSFYGDLKVVDVEAWGKRVFYIDGMPNTVVDLKTLESTSDYIRSFELLPFLRPEGTRALLVGLGGGSLVDRYRRYYGIETDAVEIDGKVVEVARDWFGFEPSGEVRLEDGRRALERPGPGYDFIVVDAFNGDQHPIHLFTREAFEAAARRLKPEGVLSLNVIGFALGAKADLRRSVERTLKASFRHVRVLAASSGHDPRSSTVNLTFFASDAPLLFRREPARGRPELADYYAKVQGSFLEGLDAPSETARARLLTDDDNPVDALAAESGLFVRRALLQQSAGWMAD
ncbi:MAG TPA: hypothetical protein DCM05_07370 [Elusimicrobia bacterium]|nr:hypothetical protein [Elusimicrobiota bacterium]